MFKKIILSMFVCTIASLQAVDVYLVSKLKDNLTISVNGQKIKDLTPCCCPRVVRPNEPREKQVGIGISVSLSEECNRCSRAKLGNLNEINTIEVEYGSGLKKEITLDDAKALFAQKIQPEIDKDPRIADYYSLEITIGNRYSPELEEKIIKLAKGAAVSTAAAASSYALIYGCQFLGYDASILQTIIGTGVGAVLAPYVIKPIAQAATKGISAAVGERICQALPIGKSIATFIHNLNPWSVTTTINFDSIGWTALKAADAVSSGMEAVSSTVASALSYVPYLGTWYCSEPKLEGTAEHAKTE